MRPLLGRLLLLLLLACDWAADPCQGTSPLSEPFASTETFCHSLIHRVEISRQCAPLLGPLLDLLPCSALSCSFPPATAFVRSRSLDTDLVYLFRSIRR
jgi:hypothetical protein